MRFAVNAPQKRSPQPGHPAIHPDVLRLGVVSLLTDVSSEMIFSVFAVFFTSIAGGSAVLLGCVEGLADFASCSLDYLSGWRSDLTGNRKSLALLGYGFSTAAKSILLIAVSVPVLGAFRVLERLGKSVRGPPRDAWLADVAQRNVRGYSFGLHKALDKSGAVLGPLLAYAMLVRLGSTVATYRTLFRIALIPALLALVLLACMTPRSAGRAPSDTFLHAWRTLGAGLKRYLAAAGVFSLGYFSFGFLLLRAYELGFTAGQTVLLYALFNGVFVLTAPAAGRIGDVSGRTGLVAAGYGTYLVMCLGFAAASAKWQLIALFALYGVFFAIDEAQSKAFIADVQPQRRATAMGAYNFLTGGIYLIASLLAGALWQVQPGFAFLFAAATSAAAVLTLLWLRPAEH